MFPGVFPSFLTPLLTQVFFPMTLTTFLTSFRKGERRKYAGHEVFLNQVSNLQPPGHDDTLTTGGTPKFWNIMRCHKTEKKGLQDRPSPVLSVL